MVDKKITELTELTSPVDDDLLVIVDDVVGTPTTKKVTLANVEANISIDASQISDFDTEVSNNSDVTLNTTHRGLTNNPHSVVIGDLDTSTLVPYSDATGPVDLGENKLTANEIDIFKTATHGELRVGNDNSTPSDNLGGYLYIGKFGAPQGSENSVGAVYFESKTTDSITHVAGVQANIVVGNTTRSLTTGNLDFSTKGSGMDDPRSRLRMDENGNIGFGGTITDFAFTGADMVLKNGNLGIGIITAATKLHVNGAITQTELSADPTNPAEGQSVIWQSDGTGSGDDGDIMMKITAGATTKTVTLVDFSEV